MIQFITENWKDLALIGTSVVTIASVIVKLTPTDKDNKVFNKIMKILSIAKKVD